jgi:hypothetical protein
MEVWEANRMNWKTKASCLSHIQHVLKGFALPSPKRLRAGRSKASLVPLLAGDGVPLCLEPLPRRAKIMRSRKR